MTIYVGQTFRAMASSLTSADGSVLVSPVVTITLVDPSGIATPGTVIAPGGGVYYAEFAATQQGNHKIVARAVAGGGTWIGETTQFIGEP